MENERDILERLASQGRDTDMAQLVEDAADEIRRLRLLLAIVADPKMWGRINSAATDGFAYYWRGTAEFADPMAWAKREAAAEEPDND